MAHDTDPKLLEYANKDSRLLVDRLEREFGAEVVKGDGFVEIPGYGLLVEKVTTSEQKYNKRTGSTDIRYLRGDDVAVRHFESRKLTWVKVEPALEKILLADIAAERKAAEEQEKRQHEAQEKHQQLVREAKTRLTPEQLEALQIEFNQR